MKLRSFLWLIKPQVLLAVVCAILLGVALVRSPTGSTITQKSKSLTSSGSKKIVRSGARNSPPTRTSISAILGASTALKPSNKPMLALSFDDGPNPLTTPLILNTLEENHVHASFFIVGSRVAGAQAILRREYDDGDDIGNHSWSHPDFGTLNGSQIANQINRTQGAIAAAGVPAPFMFRPPYGDLGPNFPKHLPLAIILWDIDPRDWADHNAVSLSKRILSEARPGGIIDMHGIYLATAQAVETAIPELKQHYQLVTVSKLLNIKPGTTGIFYGHR